MNQPKSPRVFLLVDNPDVAGFRLNRTLKIQQELEAKGYKAPRCTTDPADLRKAVMTHQPDLLFSISFYPHLSQLAVSLKIDYLAWDFDKVMNLDYFNPAVHGPRDHMFMACIDDAARLREIGLKACFLPAVPDGLLDPAAILTQAEEVRYGHDIAFIGASLMQTTNDYQAVRQSLLTGTPETAEARAGLLALCERALADQEPFTRVNDYRLPRIMADLIAQSPFAGTMNPDGLTNALAKECCRIQRRHYLQALTPRSVDVYGPEDWRLVDAANLNYRGFAQYDYETGKIFRASKINLNLQRIYALDGFSNRVFNVLAQGGFLLNNRPPKLAEFFKNGAEWVLFDSAAELNEAVDYYLNHPDERLRVAQAGRDRVLAEHHIGARVNQILAFYLHGIRPFAELEPSAQEGA